jgi:hypothetical protein
MKQTLTKQFFLQQSTKCQWRIEKPLKFSGIWENFVQPPSPPMYLVFLFKKKSYRKSQVTKLGTEMEIFFSFPVADPDILKI